MSKRSAIPTYSGNGVRLVLVIILVAIWVYDPDGFRALVSVFPLLR